MVIGKEKVSSLKISSLLMAYICSKLDLDILSSFSLSTLGTSDELFSAKLNTTKIKNIADPIKIFGLNILSVFMISTNVKLLLLSFTVFFLVLGLWSDFF